MCPKYSVNLEYEIRKKSHTIRRVTAYNKKAAEIQRLPYS